MKIGPDGTKTIDYTGAKPIDGSIWYSVPGGNSGPDFFLKLFWFLNSCVENYFGAEMYVHTGKINHYVLCSTRYNISTTDFSWRKFGSVIEKLLNQHSIAFIRFDTKKGLNPLWLNQEELIKRKNSILPSFFARSHDIRKQSQWVWYNRFTKIFGNYLFASFYTNRTRARDCKQEMLHSQQICRLLDLRAKPRNWAETTFPVGL